MNYLLGGIVDKDYSKRFIIFTRNRHSVINAFSVLNFKKFIIR